MKKLLKAVALATVMCLLLSTAAFASDFGTATGDKDTKYINVNVTNAGAGEQVVLMLVETGVAVEKAEDGNIMYIDQTEAEADETAKFTNIIIKDTETVVDIYVGSAETDGAQFIATVDVSDVKEITLAKIDNPIITVTSESAEGISGFAAAITVNVPESLTIDKMIWGFTLSSDAEGVRRYSEAYKPEGGTAGDVQFAAAFDLGAAVDNLTVSNVSAIFLTGEGTEDEAEHFTRADLDQNNKHKDQEEN